MRAAPAAFYDLTIEHKLSNPKITKVLSLDILDKYKNSLF